MITESQSLDVWDRLYQNKPLDGLHISMKDGRYDLSGIVLPNSDVIRRYNTPTTEITEIEPGAIFRNKRWRNLDFSGCKLNGVRFIECEIQNCQFERCRFQDLRTWSTRFSETSFKGANLRKASLGGVLGGVRTVYCDVDFSEANLGQTSYTAAAFERCCFRNAKLEKIDFQSSTFCDCRFEGELDDVLFYRHGFRGEAFPPNEMVNVDFSKARLRHVGFRGLVLDRVQLPHNAEHIVIKDFASTLDKLIDALMKDNDDTAKYLIAILTERRKWALPNQVQGVMNVQDLIDVVQEDGLIRLKKLIAR